MGIGQLHLHVVCFLWRLSTRYQNDRRSKSASICGLRGPHSALLSKLVINYQLDEKMILVYKRKENKGGSKHFRFSKGTPTDVA